MPQLLDARGRPDRTFPAAMRSTACVSRRSASIGAGGAPGSWSTEALVPSPSAVRHHTTARARYDTRGRSSIIRPARRRSRWRSLGSRTAAAMDASMTSNSNSFGVVQVLEDEHPQHDGRQGAQAAPALGLGMAPGQSLPHRSTRLASSSSASIRRRVGSQSLSAPGRSISMRLRCWYARRTMIAREPSAVLTLPAGCCASSSPSARRWRSRRWRASASFWPRSPRR
jgi:hypothetical protein